MLAKERNLRDKTMANLCLILGLISSVLSLASISVAIASTQWLKVRSPFFMNDVGLMRHCDVVSSYCGDMERLHDLVNPHYVAWFKSVQAIYLLHCIGALIVTVMYILYAVKFLESKDSFKVVTAFNSLTVLFGVYSVTVFGVKYQSFFSLPQFPIPDEMANFGVGFYMAVIGCCLSFVTFTFSALEASHAARLIRNMQHRLTVWTTPYTLFEDQEPGIM